MDGAQFTSSYLKTGMASSWTVSDARETGGTFIGDAGNNLLVGTVGRDSFYAGPGKDSVTGGPAADRFIFDAPLSVSTMDTVTDFTPGEDKLILSEVLFASAPSGILADMNFVAGPSVVAHDADDYILYDTATGNVSYDDDGSGLHAPIVFVTLANHASLSAQDVLIGIV